MSSATATATRYRGRFAPTPSGPLHLGSLVTALASYLAARAAGGHWLLRIDDLDGPRCRPEYADTILRQLDVHGLHWDEAVRYQSAHRADYLDALAALDAPLYHCRCTRSLLAEQSHPGPDGPVYSGNCRQLGLAPGPGLAVRVRVPEGRAGIEDRRLGVVERDLRQEVGDFVLLRNDGCPGYQLASVVDDAEQCITEVVRGDDLIGSSVRQAWLMQQRRQPVPAFLHVPVVLDQHQRKLSKQNHAAPLDARSAGQNLIRALALLGQLPFAADWHGRVDDILRAAISGWSPQRIPAAAHR